MARRKDDLLDTQKEDVQAKPQTMLETVNTDAMAELKHDMVALARNMCREVQTGSAKDYYQHIATVIRIYETLK